MPTINWNEQTWDRTYPWPEDGEEWSRRWGGSLSQWRSCIWPRLAPFLPADSLLEIAPGRGRWTHYLLPNCGSYLGVDVAESCVRICQERFAGSGARFATGDGRSLPMAEDSSVDLVFSFDSLVHCEADVIDDYLGEISRILTADGVAFLHHSNLGRYHRTALARDVISAATRPAARLLPSQRELLRRVAVGEWHNRRGRSMTAPKFAQMAADNGLACIGQEVIAWVSPLLLIDCISVVTPHRSRWERQNVVTSNRQFPAAARSAAAIARAYPVSEDA
jgi:ubiquinone/menaquinone biosynthesis C-methylase UbiE